MNPKTEMKVKEIFYSIQGEGGRVGAPSIFIRLSGCNLSCWYCDTQWTSGRVHTLEKILERISKYPCKWIVWTGGEPTLQLTDEIVQFFKNHHYKQAIETNGTNPLPKGLDYIACSPKVPVNKLRESFAGIPVNEFRYPVNDIEIEQQVPSIGDLPFADNYFLSPLFLGKEKERMDYQSKTTDRCIAYIKEHPKWRLSLQIHKLCKIP